MKRDLPGACSVVFSSKALDYCTYWANVELDISLRGDEGTSTVNG